MKRITKETSNISVEELIRTYNYVCQIYGTVVDSPKTNNLTKSFVKGMIVEDISQDEQKVIKYTLKLKDNETIDPPFVFKITTNDGIAKFVHLYLVDKDIEISAIESDGLFKDDGFSVLIVLISKQVFTMDLEDNDKNRATIQSDIVHLFSSLVTFVFNDGLANFNDNITEYESDHSSQMARMIRNKIADDLDDKKIRISELLSNVFLLGVANRYSVKEYYKPILDSLGKKSGDKDKVRYDFYVELSEKMDYYANYLLDNYGTYNPPEISVSPNDKGVSRTGSIWYPFRDFIHWYNYAVYIRNDKLEQLEIKELHEMQKQKDELDGALSLFADLLGSK